MEGRSGIAKNIVDVRELILKAKDQGQYIIGEFGQAYWLDKRHGFSPNVTASHTFTPEFFQSAGIPVQAIHNVGCCKAYDTKVGTHVFITQIEEQHPLSNKLKQLEFGATTGRQRMVGWYDAVEKGDALRYGGYQDLALNKLDALSYSDDWNGDLKICTAYQDAMGIYITTFQETTPSERHLSLSIKPFPVGLKIFSMFATLMTSRKCKTLCRLDAKIPTDVANYGDTHKSLYPNLRYIGVGQSQIKLSKTLQRFKASLSSLSSLSDQENS